MTRNHPLSHHCQLYSYNGNFCIHLFKALTLHTKSDKTSHLSCSSMFYKSVQGLRKLIAWMSNLCAQMNLKAHQA